MSETEMVEMLDVLIEDESVESFKTFEEAGVMTKNNGVVVRMEDGSEFQITVVKSR